MVGGFLGLFLIFNLNSVSLHLGWFSDLFRAYALNVRSEFPYSLLILLLDMLDDWRLVRSSTKEKGGCLSHFMLTYSVAVCFFCVL